MKYFKFKTADIEKRVVNALKMVGLNKDYLYRNPFTLSSGEKRKIAIKSGLGGVICLKCTQKQKQKEGDCSPFRGY